MGRGLTVADFFCGAGGFSEGFRQKGFDVVFALDNWIWAQKTIKLNHPGVKVCGLDCHPELEGDILNINAQDIDTIVPDTNIIIGSPPCVTFSTSNRAGKADKSLGVKLIEKFLQIVAVKKNKKESSLKYWIMENVPGSRFHLKNKYTFKDLGLGEKLLKKFGINKKPTDTALEFSLDDNKIFNAVHFGVPQRRQRFITGEFPEPTPTTVSTEKHSTLGLVLNALRENDSSFITDPNYNFKLKNAFLSDHWYSTDLPKMDWEEAMFKKQHARYYGKMAFPEDESKSSRTIMATRSYRARESFILSNGKPNTFRAPTIREAATIMSFPITYQFQAPDDSSKYRLVGNAVCPLLSGAFAEAILENEGLRKIVVDFNSVSSNNLVRDLRKEPPPRKKAIPRLPNAGFVGIVPHVKQSWFRVELDNSFPQKGNRLRWRASIHNGTGSKSMRCAFPSKKIVLSMLQQIKGKKLVRDFRRAIETSFKGKIPLSKDFQERYRSTNLDGEHYTPRQALSRVAEIVEQYFPKKDWQSAVISNIKGKRARIIRFEPEDTPRPEIPVRVIAALYAVRHVADLTRKK